jgi:hypothetical protein
VSYYRAPVLDRYVAAINRRWPHRDHTSDGWIGDRAHQARVSDHNPDYTSRPPGVVRAEDVDNDGPHMPTLIAGSILHPSTHYVIYQTTIWTSESRFRPAHYTGVAHDEHEHESIKRGTENYTQRWPLIETVPAWGAGVRLGHTGAAAKECQAYLSAYRYPIVVDGNFGPASVAALRKFQKRYKLTVDGIAGPKTLAKMRTA